MTDRCPQRAHRAEHPQRETRRPGGGTARPGHRRSRRAPAGGGRHPRPQNPRRPPRPSPQGDVAPVPGPGGCTGAGWGTPACDGHHRPAGPQEWGGGGHLGTRRPDQRRRGQDAGLRRPDRPRGDGRPVAGAGRRGRVPVLPGRDPPGDHPAGPGLRLAGLPPQSRLVRWPPHRALGERWTHQPSKRLSSLSFPSCGNSSWVTGRSGWPPTVSPSSFHRSGLTPDKCPDATPCTTSPPPCAPESETATRGGAPIRTGVGITAPPRSGQIARLRASRGWVPHPTAGYAHRKRRRRGADDR